MNDQPAGETTRGKPHVGAHVTGRTRSPEELRIRGSAARLTAALLTTAHYGSALFANRNAP